MFFPDLKQGLALYRKLTFDFSDTYAKETGVGVRIDMSVLNDAFYTAATSVKFHNIENGGVNHYKEAAHLAFWFQKFKPLRFIEPADTLKVVNCVMSNAEAVLFGSRATFEKKFPETEARYAKVKDHPLNEWVALQMTRLTISSAQIEASELFTRSEDRNRLRGEIDDTRRKFELQFKDLVSGIRYHNYTARGFATMIEGWFKVQGV